MTILLGAVADDSTGATGLANTLVGRGMRCVQVIGVPQDDLDLGDAEAVVVALKSRTAPVAEAVAESLAAARWLRAQGARQIFFKYCSTFDSTAKGNIGPVADALQSELESDFALVCPAFPAAGRQVFQGHLFVVGELLSDSPMKDHPLTPMRDSSLVRLMQAQSTRRVGLVPQNVVAQGPEATRAAFEALRDRGVAYGVVDAICDADLEAIGRAAAEQALITGGSGVALGLPDNFRRAGLLGAPTVPEAPRVEGRAAVIAGSCSVATRGQIAEVQGRWPCHKLDAHRIAAGEAVVEAALDWFAAQDPAKPLLVYASSDPGEVAEVQAAYGRDRAGEMIETAFGRIAQGMVEAGVRRLIVAGGETSGAVVAALGVRALRIGPEIDPGVPWTESLGAPRLALALKSGNFGAADFFSKAFGLLG